MVNVKRQIGRTLAALAAAVLLASPAWTAPEDLERLCVSGTVEELRAALTAASADALFPDGNRPLHVAAEHASNPEIVELLIREGASLSPPGLEGLTPLMLAGAAKG